MRTLGDYIAAKKSVYSPTFPPPVATTKPGLGIPLASADQLSAQTFMHHPFALPPNVYSATSPPNTFLHSSCMTPPSSAFVPDNKSLAITINSNQSEVISSTLGTSMIRNLGPQSTFSTGAFTGNSSHQTSLSVSATNGTTIHPVILPPITLASLGPPPLVSSGVYSGWPQPAFCPGADQKAFPAGLTESQNSMKQPKISQLQQPTQPLQLQPSQQISLPLPSLSQNTNQQVQLQHQFPKALPPAQPLQHHEQQLQLMQPPVYYHQSPQQPLLTWQ
ncbi:unnamed protein product, partial [Protopolystoma xenopodis]